MVFLKLRFLSYLAKDIPVNFNEILVENHEKWHLAKILSSFDRITIISFQTSSIDQCDDIIKLL